MSVVSPDVAAERPATVIEVSPGKSVVPLAPASGRLNHLLTIAGLLIVGAALGALGSRFLKPVPPAAPPAEQSSEAPTSSNGIVSLDKERQQAAGVQVSVLNPEPLVSRTWRTGRVALHEDLVAHVCPIAEGVVREVSAKLGQNVAAGEVLAVLDSRELGQTKLDAYKARIALTAEKEQASRTQTTMANAEELLKLLAADTPLSEVEKRTHDRPIGEWRQQLLQAYARRNQLKAQLASQRAAAGAVSEITVRKTEAEAEAASAEYTALVEELRFQVKQQVRQAELKLKEAETALEVASAKLLMYGLSAADVVRMNPIAEGPAASYLTVRAPFAGTVVEKHAVPSERVSSQTQMFQIADLSRVWVQADVFEADLPLVRGMSGRSVTVRSSVAGVSERPATVVYTGDLIDKTSRTLTLLAEANNQDRVLKPGLFVEVGFDIGDPEPVLQLPAASVLRHENKPFVFVQVTPETYRRVDVILGRSGGDRVEVTAGLKTGDRVVVRGGFVLKSELLKDQMVGE